MLRQPLAKYVLDPQPVSLKHTKPTASGGLAAASGSPSGPSNDASGQGATLEADTATQHEPSPEAAQIPGLNRAASAAAVDQTQSQMPHSGLQDLQQGVDLGQIPFEQATPALSGFSASQPAAMPAGSDMYTPSGEFCHSSISAAARALLQLWGTYRLCYLPCHLPMLTTTCLTCTQQADVGLCTWPVKMCSYADCDV